MGAWGTPRGTWPATTLSILTQIRVFVKTSKRAPQHRLRERCGRGVSELGACLLGPRGGPRTETGSRRPAPSLARRDGHRAAGGTARRAPVEAAARGPEQ